MQCPNLVVSKFFFSQHPSKTCEYLRRPSHIQILLNLKSKAFFQLLETVYFAQAAF